MGRFSMPEDLTDTWKATKKKKAKPAGPRKRNSVPLPLVPYTEPKTVEEFAAMTRDEYIAYHMSHCSKPLGVTGGFRARRRCATRLYRAYLAGKQTWKPLEERPEAHRYKKHDNA